MKRQYNYFYKITNNINQHFYYGVHCTDNLNDGYMGSGKRLHYAYKKYGMENFSKEILKFFDTIQEAYEYEAEVVTEELVHNPDCYNIQCGGQYWNTYGTVPVIDKDGNNFRCSKYDPKYLSGEYKFNTIGQITVKDKNGKTFATSINDPRYLNGELVGIAKNNFTAKDKNGNYIYINNNDPRYLSGELVGQSKGLITVKDKYNKFYQVPIDDPRYLSGELTHIWFGKKHREDTKEKMHQTHLKNKHQQGEKNSQFGTCWVYKLDENNKPINIKIKKEEIDNYIKEGWIKGRKIKGS